MSRVVRLLSRMRSRTKSVLSSGLKWTAGGYEVYRGPGTLYFLICSRSTDNIGIHSDWQGCGQWQVVGWGGVRGWAGLGLGGLAQLCWGFVRKWVECVKIVSGADLSPPRFSTQTRCFSASFGEGSSWVDW